MAFHENPRFTDVIDILVKESDLKRVEELLGNLIFFKSTDPHHFLKVNLILHRFVKTKGSDYLVVDILCGKENTFNSIFENTVKTEWEKSVVCIASRDDLIQLKKFRNSDQDKIDIKNLDKNENKTKIEKKWKSLINFTSSIKKFQKYRPLQTFLSPTKKLARISHTDLSGQQKSFHSYLAADTVPRTPSTAGIPFFRRNKFSITLVVLCRRHTPFGCAKHPRLALYIQRSLWRNSQVLCHRHAFCQRPPSGGTKRSLNKLLHIYQINFILSWIDY